MNDMNEELQENARETEMELREELDMSKSQVSQYQIKINQFQENTHDHQETIAKFRQLTASLQVRFLISYPCQDMLLLTPGVTMF